MKDQSLAQWFRQMAVLLHCGIPAIRALQACARQTSDPRIQRASEVMVAELRVGQRLSQSMQTAGTPFGQLHCSAIEIAERQGDLSLVFERLAVHAEDTSRVRRRVISALAYPGFVIVFAVASLYLLVRFLAPVLGDVSRQMGQESNLATDTLLWLGSLFEMESLMLALALLGFFSTRAVCRFLWCWHRLRTERIMLRLPLLGRVLRLAALIRICATLEMMVGAGLPLTEGFTLAARCCGSEVYANEVLLPAVQRIRRGESVLFALRDTPRFPASFRGLLLAGEESGRLEESFAHLSRLYEVELVSAVDGFLAALEPLSIGAVGMIVLSVLLVVFVPLSRLVTAV